MPPTACELEAAPIPRKESGKGKSDGKRMVVDGSALGKDVNAYPLALHFGKSAVEKVHWARLDVLHYVGLAQ